MRNLARAALPLALFALALSGGAAARETGDWSFTIGAHMVDPSSDNGTLAGGALQADVGGDWRPTVTAEYFLTPNVGIEILASLPFEHDIELNGAYAGSTRHLPPTVSLQYHFDGDKVSPFVGLGLNYTLFFDSESAGPLAGADLDLDNSWGLAAHAGLDFALTENRALRVDVRWIDIDTDVSVNGARVGTTRIDPMVYGVAYVWNF